MIILGHSGPITHFQTGQTVDGAGQNSFRNLLFKSFPLVYVENTLNKHPFLDLGHWFVWGSKRLSMSFFWGWVGGEGSLKSPFLGLSNCVRHNHNLHLINTHFWSFWTQDQLLGGTGSEWGLVKMFLILKHS